MGSVFATLSCSAQSHNLVGNKEKHLKMGSLFSMLKRSTQEQRLEGNKLFVMVFATLHCVYRLALYWQCLKDAQLRHKD